MLVYLLFHLLFQLIHSILSFLLNDTDLFQGAIVLLFHLSYHRLA
ncbi:hypothetical protein OsccyDRAFT_0436 [Leptolyngbyaceae cyanobacterium JSC-12]|nr:hypothetical protein OsccyDRAFT_0436 [Leptolyngbyaceae cyanobacterium JSC-12]